MEKGVDGGGAALAVAGQASDRGQPDAVHDPLRRLLRFVRSGHAVAAPALGDDPGGVARIVAELVAQPLDEGPHELPRLTGGTARPHLAPPEDPRVPGRAPSTVAGDPLIKVNGVRSSWLTMPKELRPHPLQLLQLRKVLQGDHHRRRGRRGSGSR